MGLVGLFVGPVLMALLVAIWREWILDDEPYAVLREAPVSEPQARQRASAE
jgi:predicted PurR-regulated permease PerM